MLNAKIITGAIFVLMLAMLPVQEAHAIDAEKKAVMKELMEITGSAQIGMMFADNISQQMTAMIKKQNPDTPPHVYDAVEEEVRALLREEVESGRFYENIYPIYDEKFTTAELKEIVAFYKTPIGAKVTKELPAITQQSMMVSQKWAMGLGPKLNERITKRLQAEQQ